MRQSYFSKSTFTTYISIIIISPKQGKWFQNNPLNYLKLFVKKIISVNYFISKIKQESQRLRSKRL